MQILLELVTSKTTGKGKTSFVLQLVSTEPRSSRRDGCSSGDQPGRLDKPRFELAESTHVYEKPIPTTSRSST